MPKPALARLRATQCARKGRNSKAGRGSNLAIAACGGTQLPPYQLRPRELQAQLILISFGPLIRPMPISVDSAENRNLQSESGLCCTRSQDAPRDCSKDFALGSL